MRVKNDVQLNHFARILLSILINTCDFSRHRDTISSHSRLCFTLEWMRIISTSTTFVLPSRPWINHLQHHYIAPLRCSFVGPISVFGYFDPAVPIPGSDGLHNLYLVPGHVKHSTQVIELHDWGDAGVRLNNGQTSQDIICKVQASASCVSWHLHLSIQKGVNALFSSLTRSSHTSWHVHHKSTNA